MPEKAWFTSIFMQLVVYPDITSQDNIWCFTLEWLLLVLDPW